MKITFTTGIPMTSENLPMLDAIRAWNESIPSIYCLDICSVSRIKKALVNTRRKDISSDAHIAALRKLDKPQNAISYITALMEKASDQNSSLSKDDLIKETERDIDAIRSFFTKAKIFEPKEFVFYFIQNLNGMHLEILGENYHSYLQAINSAGIYNTPESGKRLAVAKRICNEAQNFGITTTHPIVLASLACIYGCSSAKRIMKFKQNPKKFNSSNALADIQTIQRIGKLSNIIEGAKKDGSCHYMRVLPITTDLALEEFYDIFTINCIESKESEFDTQDTYAVSVKAPKLFPVLYGDGEMIRNSDCEKELRALYNLFGLAQH